MFDLFADIIKILTLDNLNIFFENADVILKWHHNSKWLQFTKTISLPKCCQINVRQLLKISNQNINASKSYDKMNTAAGQPLPPPPCG